MELFQEHNTTSALLPMALNMELEMGKHYPLGEHSFQLRIETNMLIQSMLTKHIDFALGSKDNIRVHELREKPSLSSLGTPGPSRPISPVQNGHDHNANLATDFSTVL